MQITYDSKQIKHKEGVEVSATTIIDGMEYLAALHDSGSDTINEDHKSRLKKNLQDLISSKRDIYTKAIHGSKAWKENEVKVKLFHLPDNDFLDLKWYDYVIIMILLLVMILPIAFLLAIIWSWS
jgi:hypothetical protein